MLTIDNVNLTRYTQTLEDSVLIGFVARAVGFTHSNRADAMDALDVAVHQFSEATARRFKGRAAYVRGFQAAFPRSVLV